MQKAKVARLDEERTWRAVVDRDARFDGTVVFAVRTTGIYCRPSCPARRPRRQNVVFFPLPQAAEAAGFRACRRCRPQGASPRDAEAALVRAACRHLQRQEEGAMRLAELAEKMGRSPHHLQRVFKRVMGISPRQYAEAVRLGLFRARVRKSGAVTHALYEAGYGSSSRLYETAGSRLGMTPATYRRGGAGMQIDYAVVSSSLGRLLVAATERGVAAVSLGDTDTGLVEALRKEYPAAEIRKGNGELTEWVQALVQGLESGRPPVDLPLDIRATAFQWQVWQRLRRIPLGQTRTYSAIAREIGRPTAVRAVAQACASNPVALTVPCHRVVPQAGGTGGYRWGQERKRRLLEQESLSAKNERGTPNDELH